MERYGFFHTTKNSDHPMTSPGLWREANTIPVLLHCAKEKTWISMEIHRKLRPNSTYLWHCDKRHGFRKRGKEHLDLNHRPWKGQVYCHACLSQRQNEAPALWGLSPDAKRKGGWTKYLCRTGWGLCGARLVVSLERSLCWYGIHSEPTCHAEVPEHRAHSYSWRDEKYGTAPGWCDQQAI